MCRTAMPTVYITLLSTLLSIATLTADPMAIPKSPELNAQGTSGRVLFEGRPLSECDSLDRFRSRKLGFVFQSFYLLPTLTALENVQIPMFPTRL